MGINTFPNKPWFLVSAVQAFGKHCGKKEKLLVTSNFSFSHRVFYSFGELSHTFIKLKIVSSANSFSLGGSKIWERVNSFNTKRTNRHLLVAENSIDREPESFLSVSWTKQAFAKVLYSLTARLQFLYSLILRCATQIKICGRRPH